MGTMRRFRYAVPAAALAGAAAFILWGAASPATVDTAQAIKGRAVEAVYATAVVEPLTWAEIASPATGKIVEVFVQEGQDVKKNNLLARMDSAPLQAELEEAQAREDYLAKDFARAEKLLAQGNLSRERYDSTQSDLAQTRAHIRALEEQIRQLSLIAPTDGAVLWHDAREGEIKHAGETVFWVGQPRPLRLDAEVDEEDIPKIAPGQPVLITADAFPDEIMKGTVQSVSPKGDPVTESYRMYAALPDDTKLMIGMSVETNTIVREKDNTILIPADALQNGETVWIAEKDGASFKARSVHVKPGISGKDMVEIPEGIVEGALVILPPFTGLEDGMRLRIGQKKNADEKPSP